MHQAQYSAKIKSFGKNNCLVIVSNRAPFSITRNNNRFECKRSGGGLVSALSSLKNIDFCWIASAQTDAEREIGLNGHKVENINVKFLDIPEDEYKVYYNKVCNQILWYAQHGIWDNVYNPSFDLDSYAGWKIYQKVNQKYAKAINAERNGKQKFVMIQDYHLYLVPYYLRKINPDIFINYFVHIPWPPASAWEILPEFMMRGIINSLMKSNIVAFHSQHFAMNFFSTVSRYAGLSADIEKMKFVSGRHEVKVRHFPISIDNDELFRLTQLPEFKNYMQEIVENSAEKIIVRVDRADLSKNIIRGFLAFERLLEKRKDLLGKVTFNAMIYKTRSGLNDYGMYLDKIKSDVARINSKYGNKNWQPIKLRIADNYLQSLAALSVYDVLLVNPIADGMNLVAKEGPVVNKRNGILILSKMCGAHNELGGFCLSINPFDIAQTASALEKALTMDSDSRKTRSQMLKMTVAKNNSEKWLYYNITAMEKLNRQNEAAKTGEITKKQNIR